jgi:tetratricopeptide (TPR) repeat protein
MQPPYNKKANHRLHIMGGVILNASSSIMAMCIVLSSLPISFHGRFILILISFYGLGFSLLNGIPIHIIKISNDGEIFRYLKDKSAAKSYYLQMNVTQKIKNGLTYKNLKEEILYLEKDADLTNAILGWHKVLEGYYYMDLRQWDKAIKCIEIFDNVISEIKQVQRITVLSEKLFIKLFTGNDTGEIETLYEETKEMLRSDKADFHMLRIRFAYEFFMDNSEDNKEKIRREVDELRKSYPYKGEALFCAGLITEMLDKR